MPVPTALDGLPRPPCAELLGWEVVEARPADGWIRIRFEARPEFVNPAGFIQGGFLAAMGDCEGRRHRAGRRFRARRFDDTRDGLGLAGREL